MDKVVYRHIRLDSNQVFYIGMGNKSRPYQKINRNEYWHFIVKKFGYKVDIVANNLTKEKALELEHQLIKFYGRIIEGGTLVNMKDDSRSEEPKIKKIKAKIS